MKTIKKILKLFFITLVILIVMVIGPALILIWRPELIINNKNLRTLAGLGSRVGVALDWDQASIEITSLSFLDKRIKLSFDSLCFYEAEALNTGCFKKGTLTLEGALEGREFKLKEVGPIQMTGGDIRAHLTARPRDVNQEITLKLPKILLPKLLHHTRFQAIQIEIDHLALAGEQELFIGDLQVLAKPTQQGYVNEITLKARVVEGYQINSGNLSLTLGSPSYFRKDDWTLQLSAHVQINPIDQADVSH